MKKSIYFYLRGAKIISIVLIVFVTASIFFIFIEIQKLKIKSEAHLKINRNLALVTTVTSLISTVNKIGKDKSEEKDTLLHIIIDSVEKDNSTLYTTLILISSFVNHKSRRNTIRKSWGNSSNWNTEEKYLIVFVVGRVMNTNSMIEIAEEAKLQKDILYLDVFEDFYLLTKKVIIGLIWAKHNINFKALLKGDDDTFMNLDNIMKFVKHNEVTDGYFGNKIDRAYVKRSGRYQVTKDERNESNYNPYCSGGGFILTNSSVYKMIPIFDLKKIFRIDDVFIGEVAYKVGIKVRGAKGFYMYNSWCEYKKDIMVSHPSIDSECNSFLLKRSMIDNKKLPRNIELESTRCYKNIKECINS
ncbi:UDP-GlcNAc:betaGal beta-1,3-N-acetylglucosaminyltransferase 7 isoform X1 [Hydra vulgaris]|uniref:Hexosyltransferase n=1 Tax=Hydra vulgaris TaxID=6087 RepID=A0ABM4CEK2_HYDVU